MLSSGELLGVEYLYNQTGKVLQDMESDQSETDDDGDRKSEQEAHVEEDEEDDEGFGEIEDFIDLTIPPLDATSQAHFQQQIITRQPGSILDIPSVEEYHQAAVSSMYIL